MRVYRWENVRKDQMNPKLWRKFITGDRMTVAQIGIARGGIVPTHQHESEQISCVLEGSIKFTFGGEDVVVRAGEAVHIPSNVPHSAEALEDFFGIDVFSPVREDWLTGADNYLRAQK